jgi:hypothetical protein
MSGAESAVQLNLFADHNQAESADSSIASLELEQSDPDVAVPITVTPAPMEKTEPLEREVVVLNDRWRVRLDDPLEWVLEVRKGRETSRSSGFRGSAWCVTRTALMQNIRERCGEVNPEAWAVLESLPTRRDAVAQSN